MKKYKITIEKFDRTDIEGGAYIDENKEKILEFGLTEVEGSTLPKQIIDGIFRFIETGNPYKNI